MMYDNKHMNKPIFIRLDINVFDVVRCFYYPENVRTQQIAFKTNSGNLMRTEVAFYEI